MNLDKFNIPRYLGTLPLFSSMRQEDLQRITSGSHLRRLERGRVLFSAGQMCDAFHIVVLGQVKLFALSPMGTEKVIEICGPGYSFAEAVMFMNMPYVVSAQTLTDSLLLSIEKSTIVDEIHANPDLALRMLAGLSRRLHGLIKDVKDYALHSGVQRVIGYLLRDCFDEANPSGEAVTVSLPVSKASIASRLSLTPEYFSRVLHELESAGLIRVDKRNIHIANTLRLSQYPQRPEA